MPSFDVVSKVDMQEIDNAVNQSQREIEQRFDFKGGKSNFNLDKEQKIIRLTADDEFKLRSMQQILEQKLIKRKLDIRCLDYSKATPSSGSVLKQECKIKMGIERDIAKKICSFIKEAGLKIQPEIQDEQIRISGKKIDDLQAIMQSLKGESFGIPLQFENMRS